MAEYALIRRLSNGSGKAMCLPKRLLSKIRFMCLDLCNLGCSSLFTPLPIPFSNAESRRPKHLRLSIGHKTRRIETCSITLAAYDVWARRQVPKPDAVCEVLKAFDANLMRCYEVSSRVNLLKNDDAACGAGFYASLG